MTCNLGDPTSLRHPVHVASVVPVADLADRYFLSCVVKGVCEKGCAVMGVCVVRGVAPVADLAGQYSLVVCSK